MKKYVLFSLLIIPFFGFAQLTHEELTFEGNYIPFMRFLPRAYSPTSSLPVIIYLSGQGETRNVNDKSQLNKLSLNGIPKLLVNNNATMEFDFKGNTYSFVVLAPQKLSNTYEHPILGNVETPWEPFNVEAMINYVKTELPGANPSQIFLTGFSVGGGGVYDYPSTSVENADKLLGIVPVSGIPNIYSQSPSICNIRTAGTDVYALHGIGDPVISIDSVHYTLNYLRNNCTGDPIELKLKALDQFPANSHNPQTFDAAYDTTNTHSDTTMYQWMIIKTLEATAIFPVKLTYFKGKSLNDQNILQWATSRELNSDRFELLRSTDGENFTVIATFKTSENSAGDKEYSFKDNSAPKGTSYYQLRQVDKDGKFTLSRVITIQNKNQVFVVEKYPNPVTDRLNITIEGSIFGPIDLQVLDMRGNLVKKVTIRKEQSNWKGFIDVTELSKGVYMFHMKASDGKREVSSFIKN